jgi:hypothetical protein
VKLGRATVCLPIKDRLVSHAFYTALGFVTVGEMQGLGIVRVGWLVMVGCVGWAGAGTAPGDLLGVQARDQQAQKAFRLCREALQRLAAAKAAACMGLGRLSTRSGPSSTAASLTMSRRVVGSPGRARSVLRARPGHSRPVTAGSPASSTWRRRRP